MAKLCRRLGIGLLDPGFAFIAFGLALKKVQELMSPFNLWNFAAMVLTLTPGAFFLWLADRFER